MWRFWGLSKHGNGRDSRLWSVNEAAWGLTSHQVAAFATSWRAYFQWQKAFSSYYERTHSSFMNIQQRSGIHLLFFVLVLTCLWLDNMLLQMSSRVHNQHIVRGEGEEQYCSRCSFIHSANRPRTHFLLQAHSGLCCEICYFTLFSTIKENTHFYLLANQCYIEDICS